MKTNTPSHSRWIASATILTLVVALGACSNMSRKDENTAIGAGVGAVSGSVLTGGSTLGTLGGAVIGGAIGNRVDTKGR